MDYARSKILNEEKLAVSSYVRLICGLLLFFLSQNSPAPPPTGPTPPPIDLSCDVTTDYTVANLNELKSKGGDASPTLEFIEVKILADNTDIAGWELCESDNPTKESCAEMGVGDGTWYSSTQTAGQPDDECTAGSTTNCTTYDAGVYLVYPIKNVKADAGEVLLRSSVGAETGDVVLDYIRYSNTAGICGDGNERWNIIHDNDGGASGLDITVWPLTGPTEPDDYTQCSACFDARDPAQKDFARGPDGDGSWGNNGDAPSEGSSNDSANDPSTFQIVHDGFAITCAREAISITILNTGGNPVTNFTGTIDLLTSTSNGNWFTVDESGASVDPAQGTLTDTTPDDGMASYVFDVNDAGTVTLYLANPNVESLTVTVQDPSGTPTDTSTTISFLEAGLRVTDSAAVSTINISTKIAGKDSDSAGFGQQALFIQAIRTDNNTGSCTGIFQNQAVSIDMAAECINPSICESGSGGPGSVVSMDDNVPSSIPMGINDSSAGSPANFASITLDFDADSKAPLVFNYPDAGQLTLHMRKLITETGVTLTGSSNPFVVRPFAFHISVPNTNAPHAADATGNIFMQGGAVIPAGEDFTVTVRAVAWNTAGDADNDGIADGHDDTNPTNNVDLSSTVTYPTTPNFGNEGSDELTDTDIDLDALLIQPSGQTDPGLTGTISITAIAAGSGSSTAVTFNEVGVIEIDAEVAGTEYLGTGINVIGKSGYVGRFIPWRFDVTSNTPDFADSCTGFTYMDQSFYYGTAPVLSISAKNKAGGDTFNYGGGTSGAGGFVKFTPSPILVRTFAEGSPTSPSAIFNSLSGGTVTLGDTADYDGVVTMTLQSGALGDMFMYQRNTKEGPFNADVDITFLASGLTDNDTVCYDSAGTPGRCITSTGDTADSYVITAVGSTEQRFGRMVIDNTVGSELLALDSALRTEYFNGTEFQANTDDSCTTIEDKLPTPTGDTIPDLVLANNVETGQTDANIQICAGGTSAYTPALAPLAFSGGQLTITFSSPGTGCTGFADITLDLSVGANGLDMDWLQYDWNDVDGLDDGPYDMDPVGRVTFGVYEGPSELIFKRIPWD